MKTERKTNTSVSAAWKDEPNDDRQLFWLYFSSILLIVFSTLSLIP